MPGAPRRGQRVEADKQGTVAGDDVAGGGQGLADQGGGFTAALQRGQCQQQPGQRVPRPEVSGRGVCT